MVDLQEMRSKRGKLPAQAKANNLDVPPHLNLLEVQLISLRIPFMKMMALPCGKQCAIHGPAVKLSQYAHSCVYPSTTAMGVSFDLSYFL